MGDMHKEVAAAGRRRQGGPRGDRPLTPDWVNKTQRLLKDAETAGTVSSQLRDQSIQLKRHVDKQTQKHHMSVNEHLRRKINDTMALKTRLDQRIAAAADEMAKLTTSKKQATQALMDRQGPARLAEKRERVRSRMPDAERINDNVERALIKERASLDLASQQLQAVIQEAKNQLRKLADNKKLLENDLSDKTHALRLDQQALEVQPGGAGVGGGATGAAVDRPRLDLHEPRHLTAKSGTLPDSWKKSTTLIIEETISLEQGSEKIRRLIAKTIQAIEASNLASNTHVQESLKNKVKQEALLQGQLTKKLQDVNQELDFVAAERSELIANLNAKQAPLAVVRERLAIRKQRPERESVRDPVEEALESELTRLKESIAGLETKLDNVEAEQMRLKALKAKLEEDRMNKSSAMRLDRRCLELDLDTLSQRSSPPTTPAFGGGSARFRGGPPSSRGSMSARSVGSARSWARLEPL